MTTAETENPAPGTGVDILGQIHLLLGRLEKREAERHARPPVPWHACHDVPIIGAVPLTAGAGTLNMADRYGPKDGHRWDVRSISFSGFTAGSVAIFKNDVNSAQVGAAPQAGTLTWSGQLILRDRDWLIFVATGITGNVVIDGTAFEVANDWWPAYLL